MCFSTGMACSGRESRLGVMNSSSRDRRSQLGLFPGQEAFTTLHFFCDWALHIKLTRRPAGLLLQEFDRQVPAMLAGAHDEYSSAYKRAWVSFEICREAPGKSYQQCSDELNAAEAEAKHSILERNAYLWAGGGSYATLLLLPAAMVIPPAIICGLLFALVELVLWIISGFRA